MRSPRRAKPGTIDPQSVKGGERRRRQAERGVRGCAAKPDIAGTAVG